MSDSLVLSASKLNAFADTDILSEQDLANIFAKHPESIKRAIQRSELPQSVPLFKGRVWTVGVIRRYIEDRLKQAQEERAREMLQIRRQSA